MSVLERVARIPPVGRRNEAVLIWGGLRGGVALALALALPERLPERDMFVAMTGGVVLATLLLNATTIGALIHRLRLDEAGRPSRFLAAVARLHAGRAARGRLEELDLEDERAAERLSEVERDAREELARIELTPEEEVEVVTRQGLFVERQAYQRLSDAGLLQPTAARTLLHEVDDQIEEVGLGHVDLDRLGRRGLPAPSCSSSAWPRGCPSPRARTRRTSRTPRRWRGGSPPAGPSRPSSSSRSSPTSTPRRSAAPATSSAGASARRRTPSPGSTRSPAAPTGRSTAGWPTPSPASPRRRRCPT
jgi:hypothetical protein